MSTYIQLCSHTLYGCQVTIAKLKQIQLLSVVLKTQRIFNTSALFTQLELCMCVCEVTLIKYIVCIFSSNAVIACFIDVVHHWSVNIAFGGRPTWHQYYYGFHRLHIYICAHTEVQKTTLTVGCVRACLPLWLKWIQSFNLSAASHWNLCVLYTVPL